LSPQPRRGRGTPASRKPRGHSDAGPNPAANPAAKSAPVPAAKSAPVPAAKPDSKAAAAAAKTTAKPALKTGPADEPLKDEAPVESRPHTEGKRAKIAPSRRKKEHGTAYRWVRAYLPILGGLVVLLAILWIYTGFINPPPPTPAQQWTTIENKWSPAREKDRAAIAADTLDFAKQQADYKDFYTQTKGWVDAVTAVKDWGPAANDVTTFLSDSQQYLPLLQQVDAATSAYDVAALSASVTQADTQFTNDIDTIREDFGLAAVSPAPSPMAMPSVNATPTPIPSPSGSPAASGSPGASIAPSSSPLASASEVPGASTAPSPSPASPTSSPS
jgi:hypothetical protein